MFSSTGDDRGVSEVIGFVLVFSLVLGTISLVYVGGLSGLDDARNAERINNAERAFDVMANNFQQMGRGDAPNRATEIKLADAQLSTTTQREAKINASGINASTASPVAIRYDTPGGDASLVYEYGAIIRVDDGSAIMRQEPDWLFTDGTIVMRFISLHSPGGPQSVGGTSSTVLVRAETKESLVLINRENRNDVNVSIQTHPDRAIVWKEYLEDQLDEATGSSDCEINGSGDTRTVRCEGGSGEVDLAVSRLQIDVTLT